MNPSKPSINRLLVIAVAVLTVSVVILMVMLARSPSPSAPVTVSEEVPVSTPQAAAPAMEPVPLPQPDLSGLEPAVAAQLQAARERVAGLMDNKSATARVRYDAWYDLGRLYQAYELWDAAQGCYRNAAALAPTAFEPRYLLARSLHQAGQIQEALDAYTVALQLGPTYPATRLRMVEVLQLLNRPQQAREQLDVVLQSAPDMTAAVVMRAEQALADKEFPLAIELLQRALAAVPRADRLHYLLAQAYRGAGQEDKARQHLASSGTIGVRVPDPLAEELVELTRGERVAILQGRMAYSAGDYQGSIEYFRRALEQEPDSIAARVNLGASLVRIGDGEGATKLFREVLEREPDNVAANFNLGEILFRSGDIAAAGKHYDKVLDRQPDDVQALLGMARVLRSEGKPIDSFRRYQRVVQMAPQYADAWIELSDLLIENKRYTEAAGILKQAHEALPVNGQIAHRYARFLAAVPEHSLRNGKLAVELAEKVFRAKPTLLHGETAAMALAQNGQCDEAAVMQQQIIDDMKNRKDADDKTLEPLRKALEHYKKARPCIP